MMQQQNRNRHHQAVPPELYLSIPAISSYAPRKAADYDAFPYDFLPYLTPVAEKHFLHIYNTSWNTAVFLACWKTLVLFPILKPGKDLSSASSYHLISLLSHARKVMEHMMATHLSWWLERNCQVQEEQCSFWPHRSTLPGWSGAD
ncbi:hypothetical protein E2C01_067025 [Portunus trituberculatus]|uniref:Uncharacterized protein n=1 Tax=Portunus trituberculatus TaxID=210409 RepID=A0A5B7HWE1_PORTR|nr:hypothetical protein [Portunus trituberculatus]